MLVSYIFFIIPLIVRYLVTFFFLNIEDNLYSFYIRTFHGSKLVLSSPIRLLSTDSEWDSLPVFTLFTFNFSLSLSLSVCLSLSLILSNSVSLSPSFSLPLSLYLLLSLPLSLSLSASIFLYHPVTSFIFFLSFNFFCFLFF